MVECAVSSTMTLASSFCMPSKSHLATYFLLLSIVKSDAFTLNRKTTRKSLPHCPLRSESSSKNSASSAADSSIDRNDHVRILNDNIKKHTGKNILQIMSIDGVSTDSPAWQDEIHMSMRWALLSHGAINDLDGPVNNYANFGACSAFSYPQSQIINIPACRMAVPGWDQEELTNLYTSLRENHNNFIRHQGFRCTSDQSRFHIRDALIWNCFDDDGEYYGQAILFDREKVSSMDAPVM